MGGDDEVQCALVELLGLIHGQGFRDLGIKQQLCRTLNPLNPLNPLNISSGMFEASALESGAFSWDKATSLDVQAR